MSTARRAPIACASATGGDNAATVFGQAEQTVTLAKDQRQRFAFTLMGMRPGTPR